MYVFWCDCSQEVETCVPEASALCWWVPGAGTLAWSSAQRLSVTLLRGIWLLLSTSHTPAPIVQTRCLGAQHPSFPFQGESVWLGQLNQLP